MLNATQSRSHKNVFLLGGERRLGATNQFEKWNMWNADLEWRLQSAFLRWQSDLFLGELKRLKVSL